MENDKSVVEADGVEDNGVDGVQDMVDEHSMVGGGVDDAVVAADHDNVGHPNRDRILPFA